MNAALFLGGLALLLTSAKYFVDGIARLAGALGVPPLVIGMTVVAFGTSTPELVVNGISASRGETALAFGNIVGSCIVNVGFVLAVTALVRPLKVEPSLITRELPMLLLAVAAFLALGSDRFLDRAPADLLARADGIILLLLFALFLYYTAIYTVAKRLAGGAEDAFVAEVRAELPPRRRDPGLAKDVAVTLAGLAGVSLGASWTVDGATGLARLFVPRGECHRPHHCFGRHHPPGTHHLRDGGAPRQRGHRPRQCRRLQHLQPPGDRRHRGDPPSRPGSRRRGAGPVVHGAAHRYLAAGGYPQQPDRNPRGRSLPARAVRGVSVVPARWLSGTALPALSRVKG